MANDDSDDNAAADASDVNFIKEMDDLLGMDEAAVEALLDKLDTTQLQELTDAVAKKDHAAAEQVIDSLNTDEEVNALFRGKNFDIGEEEEDPGEHSHEVNNEGDGQFAIGDDVLVSLLDKKGNRHSVSATVSIPDGPEDTNTIVVRIKGKPTVVDKRRVENLDENVIGMIGMPNLARIQQLAGIAAQGSMMPTQNSESEDVSPPSPPFTLSEPEPDDPMGQAMAAFDTLDAALPNIILADLKCIRERLSALQLSLSENVTKFGRKRKL